MCRATLPDLRWGSGGRVWGSQERWAGATRMCVGWREGRGPLGLLEAQGFSPRPVMSAEGEGQRSPRPAREKPARLGLAPSRGKAGGWKSQLAGRRGEFLKPPNPRVFIGW